MPISRLMSPRLRLRPLLATGLLLGLFLSLHGTVVKSVEELEAAVAEATAGETIHLADGEYRDLQLSVTASGRRNDPVVIAAERPGKAVITGASYLHVKGSFVELRDLVLREVEPPEGVEAIVEFGGPNGDLSRGNRLTGCLFERCNPEEPDRRYHWVRVFGRGHRFDHNRFSGMDHSGVCLQFKVKRGDAGHRVDHNHFHNRAPGRESNGYEMIQIGQSGDSMKDGNIVVENNYFEECDGETEVISSKTHGNVIRRNVFLRSAGTLTFRHGNDGLAEGNIFIGDDKEGSGGIRIIGTGHVIRDNSFASLTGRTGGVVVVYTGIPDSPLQGYVAADNTRLENNLFYRSSGNGIYLNGGFGRRNRVILPENVLLKGNVFALPAEGGVTALAGSLPDVDMAGNRYADGVELGLPVRDGFALTKMDLRANAEGLVQPYPAGEAAADGREPLWKAPDLTPRPAVGPKWHHGLPELLLLEPEQLRRLRHPRTPGEEKLAARLLDEAEKILKEDRLFSVTDNAKVPPSGDRRDYYSTGPYWWPNPDTPDGLPYVRRDGEFNPERDRVSDREPLHKMIRHVRRLAVAWYVTGEERFAAHAADLLHTWFLDEATGMNPHLNHAQAIPGRTTGRGTGIIDTHPFAELVGVLVLLKDSPSLSRENYHALRDWFAEYAYWLETSPLAIDERQSENNHGTAFDLQMAALLWFIEKPERLKTYLEEITVPRIDEQITPEGRQPYELKRTRSWSYVTENLEHWFKLALIAETVDVDLFAYESEEGSSLRKALGELVPYVCAPEAWPYEQATRWQDHFIHTVLTIASGAYENDYTEPLSCLRDAPNPVFPFLMKPAE